MRIALIAIIAYLIPVTLNSCKSNQNVIDEKLRDKSFNRYLLEVVNDTSTYELPALEIVDNSIYPLLDSAIVYTEKCEYFDARIRNVYAFRISARKTNNGQIRYSIYAHQSIERAIGLNVISASDSDKLTEVGIFYYKNYLFSTPISDFLNEKGIKYPFYIISDCDYRIHAPSLYQEMTYSSFMDFTIEQGEYRISQNEICGEEILIR